MFTASMILRETAKIPNGISATRKRKTNARATRRGAARHIRLIAPGKFFNAAMRSRHGSC